MEGEHGCDREVIEKGARPIAVLVQRLSEHQKKAPKGSMGVIEVIEERTKTIARLSRD